MRKGRSPNYRFTPAIDDTIRKVYAEGTGAGQVKALCNVLNVPKWAVVRRAALIGAYVPRKKEPRWSKKELSILKKHAHRHTSFIQKRLKEAGYSRTLAGIYLKRKRLRLLSNLGGMSATQCAEFFGTDTHWVTRQIEAGLLKAERRGTMRTAKQGGDVWFIREDDIREFIINHVDIIDFRMIEKFYLVELLAHGAVQGREHADAA